MTTASATRRRRAAHERNQRETGRNEREQAEDLDEAHVKHARHGARQIKGEWRVPERNVGGVVARERRNVEVSRLQVLRHLIEQAAVIERKVARQHQRCADQNPEQHSAGDRDPYRGPWRSLRHGSLVRVPTDYCDRAHILGDEARGRSIHRRLSAGPVAASGGDVLEDKRVRTPASSAAQ